MIAQTRNTAGAEQYGRHPLIRQVAELALAATGSRLLLVYPVADGWEQAHGESHSQRQPEFCRLVQKSSEGAKHCRMCHIMMAVAACSGGPSEQICHAGATVLVCPAAEPDAESMAVLSSCIYSSAGRWNAVRQRGEKLKLNLRSLRKAFESLPKPDAERFAILETAMRAMSHALHMAHENRRLAARLGETSAAGDPVTQLSRFLVNPAWIKTARRRAARGGRDGSLLVRVVRELARQRPDLPLTVKELAAAARLTPNHFTTLFREHAGCSFNEHLTEQRIVRAKKLLRNPTLSIKEIARLSGYDDPGYFTRRFRKETGLAPREWRNRGA